LMLYKGCLQISWTCSLFQVRTSCRCGDGLFYKVPPLASLRCSTHFLKTCCRPLITSKFLALEFPFHGWKSPEITRGETWIDLCIWLGKMDQWDSIRTSAIESRSCPLQFLGFSNHEKGAPRQEISKWQTVSSTFSRSGWSIVRSALFAKGGILKKRPSLHLHKVLTQSNKASPQTL
jgi:hypothetical protein